MMQGRQLAGIFVWTLLAMCHQAQGQMDEYSIKAGYLYNFSKYVTWPESAFLSPDASFVICVAGQDPFQGRLDQAIAGKTSGNSRPLVVKHVDSPDRVGFRDCQVLFLSKSEQDRARELVEALKEAPIFTVADFDSFAAKGGSADLRIEGTRVKVDLNVAAASRAGLKINARLQQVANLVH